MEKDHLEKGFEHLILEYLGTKKINRRAEKSQGNDPKAKIKLMKGERKSKEIRFTRLNTTVTHFKDTQKAKCGQKN